ncbi:hypothetical protein TBC1_111724 [Lentimicrobium saccharophilum]|uniref:Uncharacterized protein n=1 Tax=Lentimicrobium saccharophilum TaxID=1678841 RepID=A0A0S7C304_9BACT|nr:hypothetical protein TBC1_111724 [Lentimicrobium saccharophilum]
MHEPSVANGKRGNLSGLFPLVRKYGHATLPQPHYASLADLRKDQHNKMLKKTSWPETFILLNC